MHQDGQKEGKMICGGGARAGFCGDHWQTICRKFKLVHQSGGTAQTCQRVCWSCSCSSGGGWGSLESLLLREGKETRESPAAVANESKLLSCSLTRDFRASHFNIFQLITHYIKLEFTIAAKTNAVVFPSRFFGLSNYVVSSFSINSDFKNTSAF